MDFDQRAYFTELEADDVDGVIVIEVNEDSEQYRVAEKWNRDEEEGGPTWLTYWISAKALDDRIERDGIEFKKQLNDKQFKGVLNLAEVDHQVEAPA